MWSIGRSDPEPDDLLPLPLEIRPVRSARRMRLRLDSARGILKLTCPPRTSRRTALRWALEQRPWIVAQLARRQPNEPFELGARIPVEGRDVLLVASASAPRAGVRIGDELHVGGDSAGFERRVELHLRSRARELFSVEVAEFAARAGVSATAVAIGDAGTRWGSCSSQGRIRLSWRLIMASPDARRFVIAHEVAHLRHLDHGRDFHALEAELYGPGLTSAKAALRCEGPRLRRLGLRN